MDEPKMREVQWLGGPQDGLKINVAEHCTEVVIPRIMLGEYPKEPIPPDSLVEKIICPIKGRFVIWPYDKV